MSQDAGTGGSAVIERPRFQVVRRGYEQGQVDRYLTRLDQEMNRLAANLRQEREFALTGSRQLVVERDDALHRLQAVQAELDALRGSGDKTVELAPPKNAITLFGERLQTILTTAEQEASAAKAEAQLAAAQTVAEAEQRAEALVTDARQQADALLAQAQQEAATLLTEAGQETERILTGAREEATTALKAARREEHETRTILAELMRRRVQVRRHLTEIGAAIESLLGDDGGTPLPPAPTTSKPLEIDAPPQVREPLEISTPPAEISTPSAKSPQIG